MSATDNEAVESPWPHEGNTLTAKTAQENGLIGKAKPGEYPETLHPFIVYPDDSFAKKFALAAGTASWSGYMQHAPHVKIGNDEQLPLTNTPVLAPGTYVGSTQLHTPQVSRSPTKPYADPPPSQLTIKANLSAQKAKAPLNPDDMLTHLMSGDVYSW